MEKVEEDDGFNASAMLASLKKERDSLEVEKDQVVKARYKVEAKDEQLLQDKANLKLQHQKTKFELDNQKFPF